MTAASVEHQYWPFALQHVESKGTAMGCQGVGRLMLTTTLLTEVLEPDAQMPSQEGFGGFEVGTGDVFKKGHTHTLGFFRRGGVLGITAECRWTTLALLVNVDSAIHRDKNNLPGYNNVLVPLCVPEVIAGTTWPLQVLKPFELDPRKFHASQPWEKGSRVILVAYSLTAIQRAEPSTIGKLRQAGFALPRDLSVGNGDSRECVEREPTVQIEELDVIPYSDKGEKAGHDVQGPCAEGLTEPCHRVAKLDANNRADVAMQTPVWRQRFTVLNDEQAEQARRRGVRRPRSEWREIRVGHNYGDLNHVRDSPLSAFALSMYLARNRSWQDSPELEVIWEGYENPVPWLFGFQPYHLTENNTQFELDRLGEVHSMVRIGYEDAPNLHGYLFRASFGNEESKWYFIESMMTLEDRFLSAEAVGRVPVPNPETHPCRSWPQVQAQRCREVLQDALATTHEEALRTVWLGMGLIVLDHAGRGTVNEQHEMLNEFPQALPMSDELAEAVHWASTQVPYAEGRGFVEGEVHQGIRRRFGYRPETIGGALDPSHFPRLYEQGVTPERFLALREQVSGLSFIQRVIVTRAVTAGGTVDPPRMSRRGDSEFAREVEQAEAEHQLQRERVSMLRATPGRSLFPEEPIAIGVSPDTPKEIEGNSDDGEEWSDDGVVVADWEDLEGGPVKEEADFFEMPAEGSRLHQAQASPPGDQVEMCELVAAAVPLAFDEAAREELDRSQLRLQALIKRESNLHVQAVVCDSANGGERVESLRSAAQQVEQATQDLQQSYDEVLQTHVVPNAVVERDPSEWIGPMREEYEGLQKAVKPLDEATLEQWRHDGTPCEVIPAKVICSIKAPKGRRKVRCVCCGNFARSDRWSRADTYSGGIDAVTLRTLLRFAGLRKLDLGIIDVKQAFLTAPLLSNGVQIVVMTPAMFRRHRICEEKYWSVHQALYGLTISPRSWSVHRDGTLTELRFNVDGAPVRVRPMTSDPNIWTVYREEDHSVAVSGSALSRCYFPRYIQELLQRYEVGEPLQVPGEGQPQTPDEEDKEGFEGRGPEGVLKVERSEDLVEGYSDASFAPESSRSHGAFLTVWAGATINWCSKKQAYMTMSTCESELGALSDSGQAVMSICPLIN
ncbi:unnamed protein product, partial [Symbiodinium necroappetens]